MAENRIMQKHNLNELIEFNNSRFNPSFDQRAGI